MTLATGEILHDSIAVLTGTAGATASTVWGYIPADAAVTFNHELNLTEIMVQGEDLVMELVSRTKKLSVEATNYQMNETFLAQGLGTSVTGSTVIFGDPTVSAKLTKISVALVGQDLNAETFRLDIPYAVLATDLTFEVGQEAPTTIPFTITAMAPAAGGSAYPTYSFNTGNEDATIATGVLTRTAGYIYVSGEGAASDSIDSITGASLTDGERCTLTMKVAAQVITLTHLNGTLELSGDADLVLAYGDSVTLEYDTGTTSWIEIGRWTPSVT